MEKYGRDLSGIEIAGTSSLVLRQFVKKDLKILAEIRPIIDHMYDKLHFKDQKFDWILIVFCYALETDLIPTYDGISKDYKSLGIYLNLDVKIMQWCDKNDLELMREIFLIGTCEAVLHVLRKYKLPTQQVEELRATCGQIPLTIEECEERSASLKAQNS